MNATHKHARTGKDWRRAVAIAGLAVGLLSVSACQNGDCESKARDWGMETFGLTLPQPPESDFKVLPADLIERYYQGPARMTALLAQGDFSGMQAYWDGLAAMEDRTEQTRAMLRSLETLHMRGLYFVNMAREWYRQHPESPAARLVLAATYKYAAIEAAQPYYMVRETDEYAGQAYLRIVKARLAEARPLLDGLMQSNDFYGMAARQINLYVGFMEGKAAAAWQAYLELIAYAPGYEWLYLRAAEFAATRWSGAESEARFATLSDLAQRSELPEEQRIGLWQAIDEQRNDPEKNPNPQAWRPYWQARVKAAPILNNYIGWLKAEYRVSNWPAVMELSDKVLEMNPEFKLAWEYRGEALRHLGTHEETYRAAVVATLLGSSQALERIIAAHLTGGLGIKVRDLEGMYRHCQAGAALGLAAAANCMGSAHSEGFAGVRRDDKDALRWHLLAARGGVTNSQHDVAVLLPRQIPDPAQAAAVTEATGYWVRLAALYGHGPAKNKLAARPDWGDACRPPPYLEYARQLFWLIRAVL